VRRGADVAAEGRDEDENSGGVLHDGFLSVVEDMLRGYGRPAAPSFAPPTDGVSRPSHVCARVRTLPRVITAVHTLIYSDDPPATRAFLRDVLGWPCVEHPESDPGWLIFKTGPSELGVHPTSGTQPLHHEISLMCDDIEATVAELEAKGAEFSGPPEHYGFGIGASLMLPGAGELLLYEARHPKAYDL
jgi:catechol 2,3-dioxygenase-like lactoylglutathione lyase family enzyme